MKKIPVSIPAILMTQMHLRLFVADPENTIRNQEFDVKNYYIDLPLRGIKPNDHTAFLKRIAQFCRRWDGGMIFAYQIVETSTLKQTCAVHGHPVMEPTIKTTAVLGKKVFIRGKLVTKEKVRKLNAWVKNEIRKPSDERDNDGFMARELSFYFKFSAPKFLKQRHLLRAIKIGPATLVPFNKKTMAFHVA